MDLNHLIHREGEERLLAVHAVCTDARDAHLGLADLYRGRVDGLRRALLEAAGFTPALALPRL